MGETLKQLLVAGPPTEELVNLFMSTFPHCKEVREDLPLIIDFLREISPEETPQDLYLLVEENGYVSGISVADEEQLAMGFTPWKKWLALPVKSSLDAAETIVCCLYEMTMYGPDDEFQRSLNRPTGEKGRNLIAVSPGDISDDEEEEE